MTDEELITFTEENFNTNEEIHYVVLENIEVLREMYKRNPEGYYIDDLPQPHKVYYRLIRPEEKLRIIDESGETVGYMTRNGEVT